jgi:hypothetical protein
MTNETNQRRRVADVKCYFCGHVSGQMLGYKDQPASAFVFVPRPGAAPTAMQATAAAQGARLRCDRCGGPVFLEDAGAAVSSDIKLTCRRRSQALRLPDESNEAA